MEAGLLLRTARTVPTFAVPQLLVMLAQTSLSHSASISARELLESSGGYLVVTACVLRYILLYFALGLWQAPILYIKLSSSTSYGLLVLALLIQSR